MKALEVRASRERMIEKQALLIESRAKTADCLKIRTSNTKSTTTMRKKRRRKVKTKKTQKYRNIWIAMLTKKDLQKRNSLSGIEVGPSNMPENRAFTAIASMSMIGVKKSICIVVVAENAPMKLVNSTAVKLVCDK